MQLNDGFIEFVLNMIEDPPDNDCDDQVADSLIGLLLSFNQHFKGKHRPVPVRSSNQHFCCHGVAFVVAFIAMELVNCRSINAAKPAFKCVVLFTCSIETLNNFDILIHGSRWYFCFGIANNINIFLL